MGKGLLEGMIKKNAIKFDRFIVPNSVNVLKSFELYVLKGRILWYVNCISIKPWLKIEKVLCTKTK